MVRVSSPPRSGPKQLFALAHLGCTHAAGTSQSLHTTQIVCRVLTTTCTSKMALMQTEPTFFIPNLKKTFSTSAAQNLGGIFYCAIFFFDCPCLVHADPNIDMHMDTHYCSNPLLVAFSYCFSQKQQENLKSLETKCVYPQFKLFPKDGVICHKALIFIL